MHLDDTIVAISTPPGRGGIGVVRLAGPEARAIAESMLRLRHSLEANRASFGELIEPKTGERIDEVVVTYFQKPHSYTTDDIVEISGHGSPVVLQHIVELALERGARLAEPGEFTMRAFLNGRLDLTQAEAVRDLIDAQTLFQARVAAEQLGGALSGRIKPIKQKLVELIATMEAGIDFAEDDISVLPSAEIERRIAALRGPLEELARSFAYGSMVHHGLALAIVGRPNVGKSSLFNRLVERERAIVTATPGTTRDLVSETVAMGGIPVRLTDTAGIRAASDEAESIGVKKSYEALAEADLVLVVRDAASFSKTADDDRLGQLTEGRTVIHVLNKVDLVRNRARLDRDHFIPTSALTGEGIDDLRSAILGCIGAGPQQESGMLTNLRQQNLVKESLAALGKASQAVSSAIPHEMILLDLYGALRPLDAMTGETTNDNILNLIFSSFCIGK